MICARTFLVALVFLFSYSQSSRIIRAASYYSRYLVVNVRSNTVYNKRLSMAVKSYNHSTTAYNLCQIPQREKGCYYCLVEILTIAVIASFILSLLQLVVTGAILALLYSYLADAGSSAAKKKIGTWLEPSASITSPTNKELQKRIERELEMPEIQ